MFNSTHRIYFSPTNDTAGGNPSVIKSGGHDRHSCTLSILAGPDLQAEIKRSPVFQGLQLIFAAHFQALVSQPADGYLDLLFEEETELPPVEEQNGAAPEDQEHVGENAGRPDRLSRSRRIAGLSRLLPAPVFINSVIQPLSAIHRDFIRINGWPGFLEMPLLEAAVHEDYRMHAGLLLSSGGDAASSRTPETEHPVQKARRIFGDRIVFVKDEPGFVNPRIVSMIINEAFYTLAAGIASQAEIDLAMKLGTGYPWGPFEWASKLGTGRIRALLATLGAENPLYNPAPELGIPAG